MVNKFNAIVSFLAACAIDSLIIFMLSDQAMPTANRALMFAMYFPMIWAVWYLLLEKGRKVRSRAAYVAIFLIIGIPISAYYLAEIKGLGIIGYAAPLALTLLGMFLYAQKLRLDF